MSTVFTQIYNLSDNVKYMNFKVDTTPSGGGNPTGSSSLADRQELMHRIQEMISTERDDTASGAINKTLGWQRIDGADSAGEILNNADGVNTGGNAAYGFLRAKCYDYSTSGHWKYLRLKLFERQEFDLFDGLGNGRGNRYLSSNNIMVLRYDLYSDWPGITAEDSAAVVDSINGGSNSAEADGYGSTDLDAGTLRGAEYGNSLVPIGFSAAYNSPAGIVNAHINPGGNHSRRFVIYGKGSANNNLSYPNSQVFGNQEQPSGSTQSTNVGLYPYGNNSAKGYGFSHNFFPFYFGVNGFGDSDLSIKNSYGELKLIIDGNGTFWGFGDQDNVGAGGVDSNSGTNGERGVNHTGAEARYLYMFNTQHQDDNPEKLNVYNTGLFAGEYKKEFGEAVSSGTLHNGIKFNAHNLIMNNGLATPPNYKILERYNFAGNASDNTSGTVNLSNTSFMRNYNSADNNTNNTHYSYAGGTNVNQTSVSGDNQNTAVTNNTNWGIHFSGNSVMGSAMLGTQTGGPQSNRSQSVGSFQDDPANSNRSIRDYDNISWKSRNIGNNTISNSANNTYGAGQAAGADRDNFLQWLGNDGAQFALTEYPVRSNTSSWSSGGNNNQSYQEQIQKYNDYIAPASGREHLSATRMHMGYLGYVGHINKSTAYSLNELFFGARHGLFGDDGDEILGSLSAYEIGQPARIGRLGTIGSSIPLVADYYDSSGGNIQDATSIGRHYVEEFHPIANSQTQYSVYEPVLSIGLLRTADNRTARSTNWNYNFTNDANNGSVRNSNYPLYSAEFYNVEGGTPGGGNKARSAFAMLGRTFGLKIFGPYEHDKYNFLDAVSIQLDDDDFYAVNPNNQRDHWVVPANTDQVAFLFKK